MKSNKLCCRIFPIVLIIISLVIALGIWYFDEGIHSFSFLIDKNEIFNFLGTVLFVLIIPIGVFYLTTEKERFQDKAKPFSLLGFLPAVLFLIYIVFQN